MRRFGVPAMKASSIESRSSWVQTVQLRGIVRPLAVVGEPVSGCPHPALVVPPEAVIGLVAGRPRHFGSTLRDGPHNRADTLSVIVGSRLYRGLQRRPHEHAEDAPVVGPVEDINQDRPLQRPVPVALLYLERQPAENHIEAEPGAEGGFVEEVCQGIGEGVPEASQCRVHFQSGLRFLKTVDFSRDTSILGAPAYVPVFLRAPFWVPFFSEAGGSGTVRPTMSARIRAECASSRAPRWWSDQRASTIALMSNPQSRTSPMTALTVAPPPGPPSRRPRSYSSFKTSAGLFPLSGPLSAILCWRLIRPSSRPRSWAVSKSLLVSLLTRASPSGVGMLMRSKLSAPFSILRRAKGASLSTCALVFSYAAHAFSVLNS